MYCIADEKGDMKKEILEYYTSNINTIESIELKTQIQNFIDYVDKVDMEQDWQSLRNESGVDINAISTFKDMMDFGNKFNETNVPESLVYLKTILNPPKTFI